MGGCLTLLAFSVSTLLWADLTNGFVWITLGITLGFGLLGGIDDYLKLTKKNTKGVSARMKLCVQILISLGASLAIQHLLPNTLTTALSIPFLKNTLLDLGVFMMTVFSILVMIGASNAVNLTDGLDGLATVPIMIAAGCFCIIAYLVGNHVFSGYLQLPYVPGAGELSILCGALIGGSLGFLWFNAPPAQVFMGDTGSLAMGGTLGTISVITKHELVLFIIGGLFVIEAMSVIIQVAYFKKTGKRIFLMAPIHHHFEKKGWQESTIVIRFWIIAVILGLIGLSTLKIR
jgi:phospho-N-acetylmuramoyl-pentapeptide-transferase